MKPRNFPEQKRQRQIRALARIKSGRVEEAATLRAAIEAGSRRAVRTKIDRTARGRFAA